MHIIGYFGYNIAVNDTDKSKIKTIIANSILNNMRFGEIAKVLVIYAEQEAEKVINESNEVEIVNIIRKQENRPEIKNLLDEAFNKLKENEKPQKTLFEKIKDFFKKDSKKPNRIIPNKNK